MSSRSDPAPLRRVVDTARQATGQGFTEWCEANGLNRQYTGHVLSGKYAMTEANVRRITTAAGLPEKMTVYTLLACGIVPESVVTKITADPLAAMATLNQARLI